MSDIIKEMYAFIAIDKEGNEGIMGIRGDNHSWLPLVGADMARVNSIKCAAQNLAKITGTKCILKKFKLVYEEEIKGE